MEILDNATIVKNLSDPTSMGNVWSMAKGLIKAVEFTEYLWELEKKHNGYLAVTDEDSFDNWCRLWDCFVKQWKEDLECLNLDYLDRWLVDDSKDITELNFRLNKVKCRVGAMWNLDDAHQLHTDLLNITDRLADVILKLRRNAYMCMYDLEDAESFAGQRAWGMIQQVCKWVRDIIEIQERMQGIIRGAENILNPQPDTKSELPTIFQQFSILRDNFRVRNAFVYAIESGLMEVEGVYFKWLKKRQLLAYFCWSVSNALMPDADKTQWSAFNGMFIAKRGREYETEDNETLRRCYLDYETKTRTSKRDTPPDGWEMVDETISKAQL